MTKQHENPPEFAARLWRVGGIPDETEHADELVRVVGYDDDLCVCETAAGERFLKTPHELFPHLPEEVSVERRGDED